MSIMRNSFLTMVVMTAAWLSSGCDSSSTSSTQGSGGSGGEPTTSSTGGGDGGTASTGGGGAGTGAGGTSTGGTSTGGGGSATFPPQCIETCSVAADCTSNHPLLDEDNYACNAGVCEYKGCISTQECIDAYMSPNWVCAAIPGYPADGCIETCSVAADCTSNHPLLDEDNCNAGVCEYKGCISTQECIDAYMSPSYVCE
jgi:hypothetical protein